uniref:ATP synthase subunit a n=1 Tax=Arthrobotrys musiformis TaxID=47236 RepID=A0A482EAK2_9PEZI|nr:ATP synthase F0 subunit a [Arthrobotrys musiformis]QBM31489.1 ATP synthase F0 subunit a [Arthrobotrys musiformis]QBM31563.1 ATP synthase F0 subunit a [Arthrobotrys musiformis]QBM31640.1 ATP synthase F0 subunit a [Arthrobotrys musiformis]
MHLVIAFNPLDQFEIRSIIELSISVFNNLHLSLTNIGLYLIISLILNFMFALLSENNEKLLMNKWSLNQESLVITVKNLVINQISGTSGQIYFPFIYTLFMFILINNLIGMVPYNFATTSHFALTFSLSFTIVIGATLLGFQKHGLKFFSLFVPAGCPLGLLPLLVLIEFISYLSRCVSLGLRLGANVMSGHMLLNILSGFIYKIMASGIIYFIIGLIPLAFVIALCGLELAIAFIQAYVFVILTSSYIKDGLYLH